MPTQRRESISQYEKASRADLAEAEKRELDVIQAYMPQQLSDAEIESAVGAAMSDSGAQSMRDMGKVMAILKPQLAGRADMSAVSKMVKARLGS